MNSLKHFPQTTRNDVVNGAAVTNYVARCGFESTDGRLFVNPRAYKVERLLACCTGKDEGRMNAEGKMMNDELDKLLDELPHGDRLCELYRNCDCGRDNTVAVVRATIARLQAVAEAANKVMDAGLLSWWDEREDVERCVGCDVEWSATHKDDCKVGALAAALAKLDSQ